jgi:hypothetical protein
MVANGNSNRVEVLTAITMKSSIFWDVTPCTPGKNLSTFRRSILSPSSRPESKPSHAVCLLVHTLWLTFWPEDETSINIYQTTLRQKLEDVQPWLLMLVPAQNTRNFSSITMERISFWLYKENKLRDWKNIFTLHIAPSWASHTNDFVVLTSLTHPRKTLLVVLENRK